MINRKCVLWFNGPSGGGKTETTTLFNTELQKNNFNSVFVNLDYKENNLLHTEQIGFRQRKYLEYSLTTDNNTLITICDSSLLKTMVDIELNPVSNSTKDVEQEKLFEYESYTIPDLFVPTHIVLITNSSQNFDEQNWIKYKKELEAYETVLKKPFIKRAFSDAKVKLIRVSHKYPEDRVNPLFNLLKT